MKKKGFTLVEILGVIVIIGLLLLLVGPAIVNRITSKKAKVSKTTEKLITGASSQYVGENREIYKPGKYCITIKQLVNDGKLTSPVTDITGEIEGEKKLEEDYAVLVEIKSNGSEEYEIIETNECQLLTEVPAPTIKIENNISKNPIVTITYPKAEEAGYNIEERTYILPEKETQNSNTDVISISKENTPDLKSGTVKACIKYNEIKNTKDDGAFCTERPLYISNIEIKFNPNETNGWVKGSNVLLTIKEEDNGLKEGQQVRYKWILKGEKVEFSETDATKQLNYEEGNKEATATIKSTDINGLTGSYYLWIAGGIKDSLGASIDAPVSSGEFKFDNKGPTIPKITNPTNGNWTNSSIKLTLEAKDEHSGMGKFQYTYNKNATQTGTNDATQWVDLKGCANKNKCTTEAWSAGRNQTVYIRAVDKVGNNSGYNTTPIKIDKSNPTCTVTKSNLNTTGGVTATINCSDNAGVKTCAGVNGTQAKKTGLKSSQTYTVTDITGHSSTCKVTVSSRTQYSRRSCNTCKRCSSAGCQSYNQVWKSCYTTKKSCTTKTKCVTLSSMRTYCPDGGTYVSGKGCCYAARTCKNVCVGAYVRGSCNTYYRNCSKCGCSSWGSYGGWSNNKPSSCSGSYSCQTRKVYY